MADAKNISGGNMNNPKEMSCYSTASFTEAKESVPVTTGTS